MTIRERRENNETNYPGKLGRKNYPSTKSWPEQAVRRVASMPSAIGGTGHKGLLPQGLPPRGTGLIRGTARKGRGYGRPLTDEERRARHASVMSDGKRMDAQITEHPIFPLLDRQKPLIDSVKERAPWVKRSKLLGSFGLVGQREFSRGGVGRNIPDPRSTLKIRAGEDTARIPSVMGVGYGPHRTMAPQKDLSVEI